MQRNKTFLHGENCTSKIVESENDLRLNSGEKRRIGRVVEYENDFKLNLRENHRIGRIVESENDRIDRS